MPSSTAHGSAEVYNIGGGRFSNCSVLEAIELCEEITGKTLDWVYVKENRVGDHIWWISDNGRFKADYPRLEAAVRRAGDSPGDLRIEPRPLDVTASTKRSVLGVGIDAGDALGGGRPRDRGGQRRRTYRVSAFAVHGVMEAHDDPALLHRVNEFEMVTPDGQPVRWALNLLYRCDLKERVYGPTLMLNVCREAAEEGAARLPVGHHR